MVIGLVLLVVLKNLQRVTQIHVLDSCRELFLLVAAMGGMIAGILPSGMVFTLPLSIWMFTGIYIRHTDSNLP